MIPTIESPIIHPRTRESITTLGKNGSEKRTKPYVPIFSRTPARMTEPAVGASVWASGSHVWRGNIGTLIANDNEKARNSQWAVVAANDWFRARNTRSKLKNPVWRAVRNT